MLSSWKLNLQATEMPMHLNEKYKLIMTARNLTTTAVKMSPSSAFKMNMNPRQNSSLVSLKPHTYLLFGGWHLKSLLRLVYVDVWLYRRFSSGFPCHSTQWVAGWDMLLIWLTELCAVWNSDISCAWSCAWLPGEKRRRRTFLRVCFHHFNRQSRIKWRRLHWSNTSDFSYIIPKRRLKID